MTTQTTPGTRRGTSFTHKGKQYLAVGVLQPEGSWVIASLGVRIAGRAFRAGGWRDLWVHGPSSKHVRTLKLIAASQLAETA